MKISAVRVTTNAVGEYRVRHPMLAFPSDSGHDTHVITLGKDGTTPICNKELVGDILLLGRVTSTQVWDLLATIPAEMRPKIVYEIDDDPWEWHPWDEVHQTLGFRLYARRRDMMSR